MKLRAITLAAAGLLAAASAQAELQTWRFTGLLVVYLFEEDGFIAPPEQTQFDLTFDTAAIANGNSFSSALDYAVIGGKHYSVSESSLVAGTPETQLYAIITDDSWSFTVPEQLEMIAPAPSDAASPAPRAISSVSEFLTTTDQQIEQIYQSHVQGAGYTWRELVASPLTRGLFPRIGIRSVWSGQAYALIGAQNITHGVPEPSALALALLGGVGAIALSRRRQASAAQTS